MHQVYFLIDYAIVFRFRMMLIFKSTGSQNVVPRPAASASLGNLLEMQVFRTHPRAIESETASRTQQSMFSQAL